MLQPKNNRSFLKWAGNKYSSLASILPHLQPADLFVEPFLGSGTVFLNAPTSSHYIGADSNPDLINLYNHVKNDLPTLLIHLNDLFVPNNNTQLAFLALRQQFNTAPLGSIERSSLFIYLNRHAFNGLCRYNSKGMFNTPFGKYTAPRLPIAELEFFHERSQSATFVCSSFEDTLANLPSANTILIYSDPPYDPLSDTANFTAYSTSTWTFKTQEKLLQTIISTLQQYPQGSAVLSNHHTERIINLYTPYSPSVQALSVKRTISAKSSSRTPAQEVLCVINHPKHLIV